MKIKFGNKKIEKNQTWMNERSSLMFRRLRRLNLDDLEIKFSRRFEDLLKIC